MKIEGISPVEPIKPVMNDKEREAPEKREDGEETKTDHPKDFDERLKEAREKGIYG